MENLRTWSSTDRSNSSPRTLTRASQPPLASAAFGRRGNLRLGSVANFLSFCVRSGTGNGSLIDWYFFNAISHQFIRDAVRLQGTLEGWRGAIPLLLPPTTMHPLSEKPLMMDEELPLVNNGDNRSLPTHLRHNDPDSVELKPTAARAAWNRFNGYGRKRVGFFQSIKAVVFCSCTFTLIVFDCSWNLLGTPPDLNVLLIFLPIAWVSHFLHWGDRRTFTRAYHH